MLSHFRFARRNIKTKLNVGFEAINLAEVKSESEITRNSEMGYEFLGKNNLTPRFKLIKLNKHIFQRAIGIDKRLFHPKYSMHHDLESLASFSDKEVEEILKVQEELFSNRLGKEHAEYKLEKIE